MMRARKRIPGRRKRFWREWRVFMLFLLVMIPFRSSVADWYHVPSASMEPTILAGDRVFVNKLAYDLRLPLTLHRLAEWGGPERGDVVVCRSPVNGKPLVKRIVAIPGDRVEMRDNLLTVNGEPATLEELDREWLKCLPAGELEGRVFFAEAIDGIVHPIMITPELPARRSFGPVTVPAGHCFALGDNRDNSADSRFFGFLPRRNIVGKAASVVVSFDRRRWHLPRGGRFLEPPACPRGDA